jgi:hypothetical protein
MASKKHIFVGDIHGDVGIIRALPEKFPDHHLIFVGDFLDSFTYPSSYQVECVRLVLDYIRTGRATSLFGNHEFSYLGPRQLLASGYNPITNAQFMPLVSDVRRAFKPFVYFSASRVLVTHAGLTKQLWDEHELTIDTLESTLLDWFRARECQSPFYAIGRARGGWDRWGGPLWCDYQKEFTPIPGLAQVFGHSASMRPVQHCVEKRVGKLIRVLDENNYNVDCLQHGQEVLEFDEQSGLFSPLEV